MKTRRKKFEFAIFIGRFQPIHKGHLVTIKKSFRLAKKLILILGSHDTPPSPRYPWNTLQRKKMISIALPERRKTKVYFLPIRDFFPQEGLWQQEVNKKVATLTKNSTSILLIGHDKDDSSYYLKDFPHWHFKETGNHKGFNATDFRKNYFLSHLDNVDYSVIPKNVVPFLKAFRNTEQFENVKQQFEKTTQQRSHEPI